MIVAIIAGLCTGPVVPGTHVYLAIIAGPSPNIVAPATLVTLAVCVLVAAIVTTLNFTGMIIKVWVAMQELLANPIPTLIKKIVTTERTSCVAKVAVLELACVTSIAPVLLVKLASNHSETE
jgi:hypothetical protein